MLSGCLVALFGTAAPAATRVLLVPLVAGPGARPNEAARFDAALARQLDAAESLRPVGLPEPPKDQLTPALEKARSLFARERYTQARQLLEAELGKALSANAAGAPATVAAAEVLLGGLELRAGSERKARDAFEQAAALDPHLRAPRGFPPLVERELDRARAQGQRRPRTELSFEGPEGTAIAIDGASIGSLPGASAPLPPGWHRLDAAGEEGRLSLWVEVQGATLHLPIVFPPGSAPPTAGLADELSEGVLTEHFRALLAERCNGASADAAVIGMLWRGEGQLTLAAAVYSVEKGGFVLLPSLAVDDSFRTLDAEAFREVDAVSAAIRAGQPLLKLPASLLTGGPPSELTAVPLGKAPPAGHTDLKPNPGGTLSPRERVGVRVSTSAPPPESRSIFSRVPKWVWIASGAVLVAGAGGATYLAVKKANEGPTGTVAATW